MAQTSMGEPMAGTHLVLRRLLHPVQPHNAQLVSQLSQVRLQLRHEAWVVHLHHAKQKLGSVCKGCRWMAQAPQAALPSHPAVYYGMDWLPYLNSQGPAGASVQACDDCPTAAGGEALVHPQHGQLAGILLSIGELQARCRSTAVREGRRPKWQTGRHAGVGGRGAGRHSGRRG